MIFALLFALYVTGVAIPIWLVWTLFGLKVLRSAISAVIKLMRDWE